MVRWDNDKVKRFERYAASLQEKRLARMKQLVRVLAIVAVLGLVVILIDVFTRNRVPKIPIDFIDQAGTVAEWKQTGFVKSVNDSAIAIVVDEATWQKISTEKKLAIASLLKAHYSQKGKARSDRLIITGDLSGRTFATIEIPVTDVE